MERIQKLIAQAGLASRRKAELLITKKLVTINGKVAKLGDKAIATDVVTVNGRVLSRNTNYVYYVLNKPSRTITTLFDPQGRQTVKDVMNVPEAVFPVGRLDYNTTGTLLFTNDGDLAHKLIHPSFGITRVYQAQICSPLSPAESTFLNSSKTVVNNRKSLQTVTRKGHKSYLVTLHQGSYHHVKKLFALVKKKVLALTRTEFAGINVKGLERGQKRRLKRHEVKRLKTLVHRQSIASG